MKIVNMVCRGGGGHIPSSFSIVDIIETLYSEFNILPLDPSKKILNNTFTLSKGHGACALYAVLNKYNILSDSQISSYLTFDSMLGGHPDATKVPGAEASTGSLGHGLPFTVGRALATKIAKKDMYHFVLVGDGECHEGTTWESAIVANNLELNNLILLVDYNQSSDQICRHNSLLRQFESFGWYSSEADGHNPLHIQEALNSAIKDPDKRPKAVIFNTVKGKGVEFMEGHGPWHYKIPNAEEIVQIQKELDVL